MKTTSKFERMAKVYRHFGRELTQLDWSDEAKFEQFSFESTGTPRLTNDCKNGWYHGKRLFTITAAEWVEALNARILGRPEFGTLTVFELYMEYPKWLVDMVVPERLIQSDAAILEYRELGGDRFSPLGMVWPYC